MSETAVKQLIEPVTLEAGWWKRADGVVVEVDVCDSPGHDVRLHYRDAEFVAYSGDLPHREWVAYLSDGWPCESGFPQYRIVSRADAPEPSPEQARISALEAEVARLDGALKTELAITQRLQQAIATYRDKALWKLIVTAYGNAPFGTDHASVVADAKAMQRAVEGGSDV